MVSSRDRHIKNWSPSLPPSLAGKTTHSLEPNHGLETGIQCHGTGLSRFREGFRKRSTSVQNRLERKLLQMAEIHMDVPLPLEGPKGVVFHVADLPGQHSRESVTQILYQSIDWLRDNPGRVSVERADFVPSGRDVARGEVFPVSGSSAPLFSDDLVDCTIQLSPKAHDQHGLRSSSNQASSSRTNVHPDLAPLVSYFESRADPAPSVNPITSVRKTRTLLIQHPSVANCDVTRNTDHVTEGRQKHIDPQGHQMLDTLRPDQRIRRKPVGVSEASSSPVSATTLSSAPNGYLGVGLRPVLSSNLTPRSVPPSAATQSTEFVDRKLKPQFSHGDVEISHRLSRKKNDRNLRSHHGHQSPSHRHQLNLDDAYDVEKVSNQASAHNDVTEIISRYEAPLLTTPANNATFSMRMSQQSKRSMKRMGIYGGLEARKDMRAAPSSDQAQTHYNLPSTANAATLSPRSPHVLRLQKSLVSYKTNDDDALALRQHLLTTNNAQSALSCLVSDNGRVTTGKDNKDSRIPNSYLSSEDFQLESESLSIVITHRAHQVRRGTFEQLGGRIVDIHRQSKEQEAISMPMSSCIGGSKRSSSARRPVNNSSSSNPTTMQPPSFYTHVNHHIGQLSSPSIPARSSSAPLTTNAQNMTNTVSHTRYQLPSSLHPGPPEIPLYALVHPDQADRIIADPERTRAAMAQETRRRLLAAADEAEMSATWERVLATGRDSEIIRKLDYACWDWKRFSDAEWDERERQRRRKRQAPTGRKTNQRQGETQTKVSRTNI